MHYHGRMDTKFHLQYGAEQVREVAGVLVNATDSLDGVVLLGVGHGALLETLIEISPGFFHFGFDVILAKADSPHLSELTLRLDSRIMMYEEIKEGKFVLSEEYGIKGDVVVSDAFGVWEASTGLVEELPAIWDRRTGRKIQFKT